MNFTKIVPKKTKKITHQDVDKATAEFLKKGGKVKKVKTLIDGPDLLDQWNETEISFNKSRHTNGFQYKGYLRGFQMKEVIYD